MKHNIDKMAAIFIASIFALSGLGIAYAAWTDTITIDGDVNTGSVLWEFQAPYTITDPYDTATWGYLPEGIPGNEYYFRDYNCDPNNGFYGWGPTQYDPVHYPEPKNVGHGYLIEEDSHTLKLDIYNAYPGYYNHADFWVHYIGSIPGKIDSLVIKNEAGIVIETITDLGIYEFDISGDGISDMQIKWGHPFGDQLHYCNERDVSFGFCFLQPLPQDSVITLYLEYVVVQWNEYTTP